MKSSGAPSSLEAGSNSIAPDAAPEPAKDSEPTQLNASEKVEIFLEDEDLGAYLPFALTPKNMLSRAILLFFVIHYVFSDGIPSGEELLWAGLPIVVIGGVFTHVVYRFRRGHNDDHRRFWVMTDRHGPREPVA